MSGTIAPTRDTATVFTLGAPQQEADDKSYSPPGFLSRSIGRISFDEAQIAKDVQTILQFEFNTAYSDYARGNPGWQNCVLWNQSGLHTDTTFGLYDGAPQITALGRQLPYLNDILTHTFNMDYLRWSRVFLVHRGLIIPHRDYLDLPDTSTRVHIPLQTDTTCMHSEQGYVYHMRKGEIWILDSTEPHAACCFSDTKRLSLCLDFIGDVPVDRLLRIPPRADIPPLFIKRAPFTGNDLDAILNLSRIMSHGNFDDIVALLAKVHFERQIDCARMYPWLIDIAERTGDQTLVARAHRMQQKFLGV